MSANNNLVHATFRVHVTPNEVASKLAGRPIFSELEVCELRFPGNTKTVGVFPAHDAEPNATREAMKVGAIAPSEVVTYAMLYKDQYLAFKRGEMQPLSGTPLSEAPFLTESKRRELKALNVHTVEALAAVDGTPLRQLGMGGREMKNQAAAYLANAAGSADVTALAAQVASLQQQIKERDELIQDYTKRPRATKYQNEIERLAAEQTQVDSDADQARIAAENEAARAPPPVDNDHVAAGATQFTADEIDANKPLADPPVNVDQPFVSKDKPIDEYTDQELKAYIKSETGQPVKGNPNRKTLLDAALELATAP